MNVLIAHVRYRHRGGEEAVVETEAAQLEATGEVIVSTLTPDSASLDDRTLPQRLQLAMTLPDYLLGREAVAEAVAASSADVVHFHNLYPLLGPGAVREARRLGCRVVQTLHNYRLSCLAGTHLYGGELCTRCRPGHFSAGIARGCYRHSRMQSMAMARGLTRQWEDMLGDRGPHVVLAPTPFLRDRYVSFGMPEHLIRVKGNSVPAGEPLPWTARHGAVFAGRLSAEKGILELVRAWPEAGPQLRVVGDGPLEPAVREAAGRNVAIVGHVPTPALRELMRTSRVLVVPSKCWEGLPLVLCEAMSEGTPVVAFSRLAAGSFVREVDRDLIVKYGDVDGLVRMCLKLCEEKEAGLAERSTAAWARHFSPAANVDALVRAYRRPEPD